MRSRLDERAAELRDEACHTSGGDNVGDLSNAPIHQADRGDQEAETVVNLLLAENEAALRQEIDEALLRLDEGTFGICEECRRDIDSERLKAIPYSRLCIRCAKRKQ
jgi:RNA polymerase-binding protein DksA